MGIPYFQRNPNHRKVMEEPLKHGMCGTILLEKSSINLGKRHNDLTVLPHYNDG